MREDGEFELHLPTLSPLTSGCVTVVVFKEAAGGRECVSTLSMATGPYAAGGLWDDDANESFQGFARKRVCLGTMAGDGEGSGVLLCLEPYCKCNNTI